MASPRVARGGKAKTRIVRRIAATLIALLIVTTSRNTVEA